MMTLANYGIGSSKQKDPNSAKVLSRSLQIRNRAEQALRQCLKSHYRVTVDKRNDIMASLTDYYSRIPFNVVIWNKYQVKQCIIDSISVLDVRFDPYKAREAFKTIETMLLNLTYLPWHSEFRTIYTYSGQFQLLVSKPLVEPETVLEAAGFQRSPDCHLHLVLVNDKMPQVDDSESVTSVLFDCMLAQVVLSNIIEVYENICRTSKLEPIQSSEINGYSWIREYFRERSHHTTEKACSNIQEILNNLANNLARLETIQYKSNSGPSDKTSNLASQKINCVGNGIGEPSKQTPQERTREFLAQQSQDDDNLLTLSNNLLRLPSESTRNLTQQAIKHNESDNATTFKNTTTRNGFKESTKLNNPSINGYNSNQYSKRTLFDRLPSESTDIFDSIDYTSRNNAAPPLYIQPNSRDVDIPSNDCEPLLPRYDRRVAQSYSQPQLKRTSMYDNDFDNAGYQAKSTNATQLSASRYESHLDETSSHAPQASSNVLRGLNSSGRFNSSPYKKYESNNIDISKNSNSRLTWACGLCTFNNSVVSDICEMCRNRRPPI